MYGFGDGRGLVCRNLGGESLDGDRSLRKGAITIADEMIIAVNESDGTVALVPASPTAFGSPANFACNHSLASAAAAARFDPPGVANGRLYLRDQEHIYCHVVGSSVLAASGQNPS